MKKLFALLLLLSCGVYAQVEFKEVGFHLGYSGFSGMTPTVTGVRTGLSGDIRILSMHQTGLIRVSFMFDKHSKILSPYDNSTQYYPSQWNMSAQFIFKQQTLTWGIEEGMGVMYLRDNTDFVESTGSIGVVFHAGPRYLLYNGRETKDRLYLAGIVQYGLGFGYSKPSFTSYTLSLFYEFPQW